MRCQIETDIALLGFAIQLERDSQLKRKSYSGKDMNYIQERRKNKIMDETKKIKNS